MTALELRKRKAYILRLLHNRPAEEHALTAIREWIEAADAELAGVETKR